MKTQVSGNHSPVAANGNANRSAATSHGNQSRAATTGNANSKANGNSSTPAGAIIRSAATATRAAITRPPTSEERRRAQRVLLRMPLLLHIVGRPKPLDAETHTVSQNGAMILIPESLAEGTKLSLENPHNQKRVDARIVRAPQQAQGGMLVPVEFLSPSPIFWSVFFPPALN